MTPFGVSAARLAGLATQALGWRPSEFWAATPAELAVALTPYLPLAATCSRAELSRLMEQDDG